MQIMFGSRNLVLWVVAGVAAAVVLFVLFSAFFWGPGMADYTQSLGNGYKYVSNSSTEKYIFKPKGTAGDTVVGNFVVDHQFDGDFIVALRLKAITYRCEPGPSAIQIITNELEYWLIDKSNDKVLMVTDGEGFARLRNEYHVPEELGLDLNKVDVFLKQYHDLRREELVRDNRCILASDK